MSFPIRNPDNNGDSKKDNLQSGNTNDPRLRRIIQQLNKSTENIVGREDDLSVKILPLVEEFANGAINQQQFLDIYRHYRNEEYAQKAKLAPSNAGGNTVLIRNRHKSNTLAYAIYESDTGVPLGTRGDFPIDPALLIPMLASYHGAAKEIFGQGIQKAEVVGGKWIAFVVGELTTMITIIANEPSGSYMQMLTKQHELFEGRNRQVLMQKPIATDQIDFPKPLFLQMLDEIGQKE